MQPPARVREDGMRERRRDAQLAEEESEREEGGIVAVLQLALEQAEGDKRHQRADTARRPPGPGDDAGREERPRDGDARKRIRHRGVQVVSKQVVAVDAEGDTADGEGRAQQPVPHRVSPMTASSDSSESWSFGMKPSAPLPRARRPRSSGSRLETSTTAAGPPASASATSKPLMSGRATSRSTSSGSIVRASSRPEAPSPASPTTSKPLSSSSRRAEARNAA